MARDRGAANDASTSSDGGKESEEARARRLRDEDMLIARAKAIREKIRALDARAGAKTGERSGRKCQWEYVLTEMRWLAKDFASERDWKMETSRQVSHLAASCEGTPMDREEAEIGRRKVRCAMVAADVAEFWAEAWERAKEKPLPNAGELVELEEEEEEEDSEAATGATTNENDDSKADTAEGKDGDADAEASEKKSETPPAVSMAPSSMIKLAATPPPPPGMKMINSWASNKLFLAMVEMKRDLVRDAIEIKEQKEQKEREKEAKKAAKKQKPSKPTRGRGAKKKEEPDEDEDEGKDDDGEDSPGKGDRHPRVAMAEELELEGMDMDMGLLAPMTPPVVEEFMPILYDAVPALNERAYRETMQIEAHKFAEYERSLRAWEENERKRARALVEAARFQAEEDANKEIMETRRAFLAAAAARGNYFDEEGYMVDIKGRRKKNKRGEFIQFGVPGHEVEMDFGVPIPKRPVVPTEDKRRAKAEKKKRKMGSMRPWSPIEDQLLCAIVHEFGSNWALITDAFAASTPIKGTYHRVEHCRWRFSHLTQMAEQEQDQNAIAALNLNKGSARMLMARALPVEDETVRIHYDRACAVMAKHMKIRKAAKAERLGMEKNRRHAPHRSWREVQTICGPVSTPVDFAEQVLMMQASNGVMGNVGGMMAPSNIMPGQRISPMHSMGNVLPRSSMPMGSGSGMTRGGSSGGMPMSVPGSAPSSAKGKMATPGKRKDIRNVAQLQSMGTFSPGAGGSAMQLSGVAGSMPATGSKSPALAPGSYNLGRGGTTATKRTTTMKKKATRKK